MAIKTDRKMVDSGVEWIGEMPDGWQAAPLRSIVKITNGGTPTSEALFWDGGMAWATPADFRNGETLYETSRTLTPEGIRKAGPMMPIGTILVSCRAPVGKVCMVGSPVSFNQGCKGIEPTSKMNSRYVFYSLQASAEEMEVVSSGTTFMEISTSSLGKISFPCPPLPLQQAISNYLDHHIGLIDGERELISKKIELLKEKRSALIFEVVTGKRTLVEAQHLAGVDDWSDIIGSGPVVAVPTTRADDPFVKSGCLVDSGVEWIGEMPEGWKAAPLRSIVKITSGGTPTSEALFWDGGMAWATPADFRNGETLYETSRTLTPEGIRKAGPMMPIGTILVSCRAPVGKVCMVGSSVSFNQGCKGIEPLSEMNSRYVFYSLQASAKEMEVVSSGTTFMEISTSSLGKISFPCPPLPIQQAIADFLDYETGLINKEIELLTAKNELLSDKRKALIFEAVTGKIEING